MSYLLNQWNKFLSIPLPSPLFPPKAPPPLHSRASSMILTDLKLKGLRLSFLIVVNGQWSQYNNCSVPLHIALWEEAEFLLMFYSQEVQVKTLCFLLWFWNFIFPSIISEQISHLYSVASRILEGECNELFFSKFMQHILQRKAVMFFVRKRN